MFNLISTANNQHTLLSPLRKITFTHVNMYHPTYMNIIITNSSCHLSIASYQPSSYHPLLFGRLGTRIHQGEMRTATISANTTTNRSNWRSSRVRPRQLFILHPNYTIRRLVLGFAVVYLSYSPCLFALISLTVQLCLATGKSRDHCGPLPDDDACFNRQLAYAGTRLLSV